MNEGFKDSHTIKNTPTQDVEKKMIYGIPENEIIKVAEEISKGKNVPVKKEVLTAIIKDIHAHHEQGKSFLEARRLSTQRWAGNYGEEYWKDVLSAIGILYSHKKEKGLEISEEKKETPSKGYKDWH